MDNNNSSHTEALNQNKEHTVRLAYQAPELTTYNQSKITNGGTVSSTVDWVGGFFHYKS